MYQIISFTKSLAKETFILVMMLMSFTSLAQSDLISSSGDGSVQLQWTLHNGGETGYRIVKTRLDNSNIENINLGVVNQYTDADVINGIPYSYRVWTEGLSTDLFSDKVFATPALNFGRFLSFDGTANGRLNIIDQNINDILIHPNAGTIEFWMRMHETPSSSLTPQVLISKHQTHYGSIQGFTINHSHKELSAQIKNSNGTAVNLRTGQNLSDGHWHHVAMVYDLGATTSIYIDGELKVSDTTPDFSLPMNTFVQVGGSSSSYWQTYKGEMDELRFWNSKRTQSEIQTNMRSKLPGNTNDLNAVWHFNEGGINNLNCEGSVDCSEFEVSINGVNVKRLNHQFNIEKVQTFSLLEGSLMTQIEGDLTPDSELRLIRENLSTGQSNTSVIVPPVYIDSFVTANEPYKYAYEIKGNYSNTVITDADSAIADSGFGLHYSFDGDGDAISIPNEIFQDSTGTVEFLIRMDPDDLVPTGPYSIMGKHDSEGSRNGFTIIHDQSRIWVQFKDNESNTSNLYSSTPYYLADTEWHHVALTYNLGVSAQLYIDGELIVDSSIRDIDFSVADFFVGVSPNSFWKNLEGSIDELVIWDNILDSAQIQTRKFNKARGDADSLRACFHFDETWNSAVAYDDGLYNFHGNITDATGGYTTNNIGMRWYGSNADWHIKTNWNLGRVPGDSDDIRITNSPVDPVIESDDVAMTNDLTIDKDASLLVKSGGALLIYGTAENNGTYTIERNTEGNVGYSVIGSPVTGASYADLGGDHTYSYEEMNGEFYASSGEMLPGVGCFVAFNGTDSPKVSISGTPNHGVIEVPISGTNAQNDYFNLVANPYAAALTFDSFLEGAEDTNKTLWIWDDGGSNINGKRAGDYITINSMGLADNNGNEGSVWNRFILSFQGFFVHSNKTSGKITFNPGMQSTVHGVNGDGSHFRSSNEDFQLIKLSLSGNDLYNEIIVGFAEVGTFGDDDGLDAKKLVGNPDISFYSIQNQDKYTIQGLPIPSEDELIKIPLGFHLGVKGRYDLRVVKMENIPGNMQLVLLDKETQIQYDLSVVESMSFHLEEPGEFMERFELNYAFAAPLNIETNESNMKVYGNQDYLKILFSSQNKELVSIHSLDGKQVFKEFVAFNNQATIQPKLSPGQVYILNIDSTSIKFIINN